MRKFKRTPAAQWWTTQKRELHKALVTHRPEVNSFPSLLGSSTSSDNTAKFLKSRHISTSGPQALDRQNRLLQRCVKGRRSRVIGRAPGGGAGSSTPSRSLSRRHRGSRGAPEGHPTWAGAPQASTGAAVYMATGWSEGWEASTGPRLGLAAPLPGVQPSADVTEALHGTRGRGRQGPAGQVGREPSLNHSTRGTTK